jgi:response regulator of citrate/malate metabolism
LIDYVNTDLILPDLHLQIPKDGIDITKIIYKRGGPSYIFITANADILIVQEAIQTKTVGYITKPIKKADLMEWAELQLAKS